MNDENRERLAQVLNMALGAWGASWGPLSFGGVRLARGSVLDLPPAHQPCSTGWAACCPTPCCGLSRHAPRRGAPLASHLVAGAEGRGQQQQCTRAVMQGIDGCPC